MNHKRHQPAHYVGGSALPAWVFDNEGNATIDTTFMDGQWYTEGELNLAIAQHLVDGNIRAAEVTGWMLNACQVYDEWFDRSGSVL